MIRSVQAVWLLARLHPSPAGSVVLRGCRCASRSTAGSWTHVHGHQTSKVTSDRGSKYSQEMAEAEYELEDVEDKIQALVNKERKRQKTVKYHILRRQMTSPGAPKRKLSWDAIEQIRYLKQERPEEWTVQRLAEGFSVTPDVILRVLRNKFVPTAERRAKQDAKVMAQLGQNMLHSGSGTVQDRLKLSGNLTPASLPPGKEASAVVPADRTLVLYEGSPSLAKSHSPASVQQLGGDFSKNISGTKLTDLDRTTNKDVTKKEEEEEYWDGIALTEDDLKEFMGMEKPSIAVQIGKEFFDAEGNFLYRI